MTSTSIDSRAPLDSGERTCKVYGALAVQCVASHKAELKRNAD